MSSFAERVGGIEQGQHLCLLYDGAEEQFAAVVPFLAEGLRRGERCVYGASDSTLEEAREALRAGGIDVAAQAEHGALLLLPEEATYRRRDEFDPDEMIEFLATSVSGALAEGFTGFRAAGEMSWALEAATPTAVLARYEALLNEFYSGRQATGLCQYDRRVFPAETIYDVLCTHPLAITRGHLCRNHFYETPSIVLNHSRKADRLEWRLSQLTRVAEGEEALHQANRLKSEFLAATSHDLRIPLNAILGYSDLLRTGVSGALTPRQQAQVSRIHAAAERLVEMIDEILAFERMAAAREEAEPERFTLGAIMEETSGIVAPAAEEKELTVTVTYPADPIWLWTDRRKLSKILLNLLSNAVKYTESGSIRFTAIAQGKKSDRWIAFRVQDTGRGIPQEHQELIFEPFWRMKGDSVTGTGLGLSLARGMARLLGGDVTVASRPGAGSTFTVRIPVTSPATVHSPGLSCPTKKRRPRFRLRRRG